VKTIHEISLSGDSETCFGYLFDEILPDLVQEISRFFIRLERPILAKQIKKAVIYRSYSSINENVVGLILIYPKDVLQDWDATGDSADYYLKLGEGLVFIHVEDETKISKLYLENFIDNLFPLRELQFPTGECFLLPYLDEQILYKKYVECKENSEMRKKGGQ
jgi:hypothetical protein